MSFAVIGPLTLLNCAMRLAGEGDRKPSRRRLLQEGWTKALPGGTASWRMPCTTSAVVQPGDQRHLIRSNPLRNRPTGLRASPRSESVSRHASDKREALPRGSEQLGPNGLSGAGHKQRRHGTNDIGNTANGSSGEAEETKRRNWRRQVQTTRPRRGKRATAVEIKRDRAHRGRATS